MQTTNSTPRILCEDLQHIAQNVQSHFGGEPTLWTLKDTIPTCVHGDPDDQTEAVVFRRFAAEATTQPAHAVETATGSKHHVVVGWTTPDCYLIACVLCDCANKDILDRLASCWIELQKVSSDLENRRELLGRMTAELARGYEELALTRQFATKQVELDASNDISCLAEQTLPDLRRSIQASTVALIQKKPDGQPEVTCRVGDELVSSKELAECACRFGSASFDEPYVLNNTLENIPSIYGLAVVSIRKGAEVFGWLIAVNPTERTFYEDSLLRSERELGSFETTLMGAAASFFSSHVKNSDLVRQLEKQLISIVRALVSTVEAKDPYTRGHSERVAEYARIISRQIGQSRTAESRIHFAGLLHDIGKIGIPDAILQKSGPLTDEEFKTIQAHPVIGWDIVRDVEELGYAKDGILHHHEKYDGTGYPHQLAGEEIPLIGRIMAVADAFDAMTSDRSYRKSRSVTEVVEVLKAGAGSQWDPVVVEAFQQVLPEIKAVASLD